MRDIDPMSEENQRADADNARYIGGLKTAATVPTVETFEDGSTIETDPVTGNQTVCGKLAHDEYFRRLKEVRIFASTPYAIIEHCRDLDGTRKAELIRRTTPPLLEETFGPYVYEVWAADDPQNVTRCKSEESARKMFRAACLHGTNGAGIGKEA